MCHVLCDRGQSSHPNSVDQELPAKSSSRSNYRGRVVSPHLVLGILFFVIMADSNQKHCQSCCDSKLKFWNDSGFAAIKFMRCCFRRAISPAITNNGTASTTEARRSPRQGSSQNPARMGPIMDPSTLTAYAVPA